MYLRSHVQTAKGRHAYARETTEAGCASAARGRDDVDSAAGGKVKTRKSLVDCWDNEVALLVDPRSDSKQAYVRRGMSEGERAVTTPRIGWRKLTDPGD
ncbi:hypothetical protein WH47_06323 [Habropoda laboriosa]|uniref:Uncharacterized protein n=1 Tax=Habropoda laboriosa TaxID=597456 RepID=A0A0L7RC19_9HYME|nr:hypothetical protein WH47_06323 [Habropoda laboriosa]